MILVLATTFALLSLCTGQSARWIYTGSQSIPQTGISAVFDGSMNGMTSKNGMSGGIGKMIDILRSVGSESMAGDRGMGKGGTRRRAGVGMGGAMGGVMEGFGSSEMMRSMRGRGGERMEQFSGVGMGGGEGGMNLAATVMMMQMLLGDAPDPPTRGSRTPTLGQNAGPGAMGFGTGGIGGSVSQMAQLLGGDAGSGGMGRSSEMMTQMLQMKMMMQMLGIGPDAPDPPSRPAGMLMEKLRSFGAGGVNIGYGQSKKAGGFSYYGSRNKIDPVPGPSSGMDSWLGL